MSLIVYHFDELYRLKYIHSLAVRTTTIFGFNLSFTPWKFYVNISIDIN